MKVLAILFCCCGLGNVLSLPQFDPNSLVKPVVKSGRAITQNLTISNPYHDAGEWGSIDACPEGSFVNAFELKYSPPGHIDETAINAVKLYCVSASGTLIGYIESSSGTHGDYYGIKTCSKGYLTGFRANTLSYQGAFTDDVAVEDLEVDCEYGKEIISSGLPKKEPVRIGNTIHDFGTGQWSAYSTCHENTVVCAIQTRYEDGSLGDETSICELRMFCCDLPPTQLLET